MTKTASERAEAQQWAEKVQKLEAEIERLKAIPKCDPVYCTYGNGEGDRLQAEIERLTAAVRDQAGVELSEENDRLIAKIEQLRKLAALLKSVIQSGEPWTETCQREYEAGHDH